MSVAVKKLDGVESVEVSLEKATADIRLKPGNRVTMPQLRRVIKNNGYPTKDAQVEARGKFIDQNGHTMLDLLNGSMLDVTEPSAAPGSAIVEVSGVSRAVDKDRERISVTAIK